jgi:hypothetical protein
MKDMIPGDVGDHRMHQRARETAAVVAAGAENLRRLHSLLDRTWFCSRHGVSFELQTVGKGLSLAVVRSGDDKPIANWTACGDTLVLTTASGTELRAELLGCAVSITLELLERTKTGRH